MEENTPFFKNYGPSYVGVSPYLQNNETPAKFRAAKQNKKTAEGENINRIKESKNSSPLEFPDSRRLARSNPIEICCAPNIRTSYGSPPVPSIASPGKLIRRHAHQTHLEAFGSKEIWVTLLVPVLLTIAAFILTYEYRFSSIVLTYPHCISDQFCALSSQLQYTLPNPVPFQEVVRSYIEIHDSRNVTNCIDNHCGSGHISAEMGIIDTVNNRPMRQENIVYADSINLFSYYQTYYSYKNDSSAHVATFYLPLKAATTDLPGMHSKRLSHRLLFVGDTNHLDTTQFVRVSYHISVENVHYMIVGAVVSLIGSIITAVVIVRSFLAIWRTASRHKNQSDEARSSIPSSLMDSMSSEDDGRYSKTIHFVLPEQIIGLSLMITLLVWQDPAGNVFSLLYYFEVVNINRLVVLASGYLRSCAMYGKLPTLRGLMNLV